MKRKRGTEGRFSVAKYLEKMDVRQAAMFVRFGKWLIFSLLVFTELIVFLEQLSIAVSTGKSVALFIVIGVEALLTVSEALKLFVMRSLRGRAPCYGVDFLATLFLTALTGSTYLCTIYMIILTEFYVRNEKIFPSVLGCGTCMVVYVVTSILSAQIRQGESLSPLGAITQGMNDLVLLFVHFAVVTVAVRFYRQYFKLNKALKELDESKAELQRAYDELAEVTVLEERQRIAKDIHDTAGHSITTVIMQTEAAKLLMDKDPEDAKSRIIAANLQAKHALEELRESVHLLSGSTGKGTIKEALTAIIRESTDGTGITIRSDIDDVDVSDEKHRFLCKSLKEGISNGLRHGSATAFWFELKKERERLRFLLSDNGAGVSIERLEKGFGLTGMAKRAEDLGGKVTFVSEVGEGFEIHVVLPVEEE
ncbi:MAG: sensor histidine kinase [Clostridia bacterium]|nr:sensor histidine kinase [Clostridia bacterium]